MQKESVKNLNFNYCLTTEPNPLIASSEINDKLLIAEGTLLITLTPKNGGISFSQLQELTVSLPLGDGEDCLTADFDNLTYSCSSAWQITSHPSEGKLVLAPLRNDRSQLANMTVALICTNINTDFRACDLTICETTCINNVIATSQGSVRVDKSSAASATFSLTHFHARDAKGEIIDKVIEPDSDIILRWQVNPPEAVTLNLNWPGCLSKSGSPMPEGITVTGNVFYPNQKELPIRVYEDTTFTLTGCQRQPFSEETIVTQLFCLIRVFPRIRLHASQETVGYAEPFYLRWDVKGNHYLSHYIMLYRDDILVDDQTNFTERAACYKTALYVKSEKESIQARFHIKTYTAATMLSDIYAGKAQASSHSDDVIVSVSPQAFLDEIIILPTGAVDVNTPVTLSWQARYADDCELNPGEIIVKGVPVNGKPSVKQYQATVYPVQETQYTLLCRGLLKTSPTKIVSVKVNALPFLGAFHVYQNFVFGGQFVTVFGSTANVSDYKLQTLTCHYDDNLQGKEVESNEIQVLQTRNNILSSNIREDFQFTFRAWMNVELQLWVRVSPGANWQKVDSKDINIHNQLDINSGPLPMGHYLLSSNNKNAIYLPENGNLCLLVYCYLKKQMPFDQDNAFWSVDTSLQKKPKTPSKKDKKFNTKIYFNDVTLQLGAYGELSIFSLKEGRLWHSDREAKNKSEENKFRFFARIQVDGNFCVYANYKDDNDNFIWGSGTQTMDEPKPLSSMVVGSLQNFFKPIGSNVSDESLNKKMPKTSQRRRKKKLSKPAETQIKSSITEPSSLQNNRS